MTDAELAAAVANAMAVVLGFPTSPVPPPTRVTDASNAAVAVARRYLYGDEGTPTPLPDPVAGPDLYAGCVALGIRIYHDPSSPGGVIGGDAYTGAAIPEDLVGHVHHYFDAYRTAWGIA